ncbi:MAG: hypothetical protein ACE5KZ_06100 [Candidatus Scalinduaceae bacterium]
MRISVKSFVIAITILFLFIGYQSQQRVESRESHQHVCVACEKGQAGETVWCDSCNAGYIDGNMIKCKSCFDGKAGKVVWCDSCNVGYTNKSKITCKDCFDKGTICEKCQKK